MNFCGFVGHDDAKLALILNAIDPQCGGVLFAGEKGSGKSTCARLFRELLPGETPFVEVPLNMTEDALLGTVDIERALKHGEKAFQPGILSRADGGVIHIDDINLLPAGMIALIFEAHDRGTNILEREGITAHHPCRFIPIATMDPDEGLLSAHFLDRFGMFVAWGAIRTNAGKMEIIRKSESVLYATSDTDAALSRLRERIANARRLLKRVHVPATIEQSIVERCIERGIEGHRGELFLFCAARAYAAFRAEITVTEEHVDQVLPLVLAHRARPAPEEQEEPTEVQPSEKNQSDNESQTERETEPRNHQNQLHEGGAQETSSEASAAPADASTGKEEIFDTGEPFPVRRIALRKDRLKRAESGRRTKTASQGKSGRYVRSGFKSAERDVALDATLRAAAPYQAMRERNGSVVIRPEDLRFKEREKKMSHLVIFVVDGSGSMGAQRRMTETKGAVQSLLLDCYRKRDKVAFIVFRRNRAEVVLPPTSSFEYAAKRLKEIPVGGRTPLSAGLLEVYRLVMRMRMRRPQTRCLVVLVTDGRANQALGETDIEMELRSMAGLLSGCKNADCLVIDTEDKKSLTKMDLAARLAEWLDAHYYPLADLRADYLTGMVEYARDLQRASSP